MGLSTFSAVMACVAAICAGFAYLHFATPGAPRIMKEMMDRCEQTGLGCPSAEFHFRAFQQLYLVDIEVAQKYVPDEIQLTNIGFGMSLGAIFIVEYSLNSYDKDATSNVYEVDVLQLAGTGPEGVEGAWASHVLLNNKKMQRGGRGATGVPVAFSNISVIHHCAQADQGITFDVNDDDQIDSVVACLPGGAGEGWLPLVTLNDHTLPNFSGRLPMDLEEVYDVFPHKEHANLTELMMYLFTLNHVDLKLSSSVPQHVTGEGKAADLLTSLLSGYVMPFSTVFDDVQSTVWDTAHYTGGWEVKQRNEAFDDKGGH